MSRTVVDLDDEALSLASAELGTTSKVATVNAALRRVANQRAAAHMLELLDETGADLSDERTGNPLSYWHARAESGRKLAAR